MTGIAWPPTTPVDEVDATDRAGFDAWAAGAYRPAVLRGLVKDWPLVAAGKSGAAAAAAYLRAFDTGAQAKVMRGGAEWGGRHFYEPGMRGYNFAVENAPLSRLLDELVVNAGRAGAPHLYAGSTSTPDSLPGFAEANPMPLATPGATPRIWIGNRSHVAPHYDISDNVAAVALGKRRFILFPPDQTPNLYVGPLDITIAGQPVSMVDLRAPDLDRYPRFAEAARHALVADLAPGDAIYIPSLWWHAVEAGDEVNILVNYWYNQPPDGSPFAALLHAMMSIRDLPPGERSAWRTWFDTYVFDDEASVAADHLPPHARGVSGPRSAARQEAIRGFVMRALAPR